MKKILHIANWYPNRYDPFEGTFVQAQYRIFRTVSDGEMIHVQVRPSRYLLRFRRIVYSPEETGYYLLTRIRRHRVVEWLSTALMLYAFLRHKVWRFDLLHFHIAYPLLMQYDRWKRWVKVPVVVSEHWSAYHYGFYLPERSRQRERIKRMFRHRLPVIVVSEALEKDIRRFSGREDFAIEIIPNAVDIETFRYRPQEIESAREERLFFAVNHWRDIKNPFVLLEAFRKLVDKGENAVFYVGGAGDRIEAMHAYVSEHGLEEKVRFLGPMRAERIAEYMRLADAYLYASSYETFCMACAEALCCGTPLIGPKLEAIEAYAPSGAHIEVGSNDVEGWVRTLERFVQAPPSFDRARISEETRSIFAHDRIAARYRRITERYG